ncbi:2-oxoacid:acceptor oxidoreductase subunit alpha [Leptonema illini]|uniref:2-oxoacid:acceptor oxidoreductase, alpha subunit n=1 Tax=Leptonema illini DSM 21528 TaxID=929563 RepID=H2CC26_9LEPT|nr:2-oxoacid:acceptor oxidoreductase subunit alpha [Leptonema illini]EHQ05255.1 2-oxoacid:acceptor oxidoreductase, alpha subunit [Leptonema illini DSM 21528]
MQDSQTTRKTEKLLSATIRFSGDSGDGMQLVGSQFTQVTGMAGNDMMTFPDFPAEIRAPQGTTAGVSGFQIHFGSTHIYTPGEKVDVLVAMNPAALKANIKDLKTGGILIVNTDEFDDRNLKKVDYATSPLEDPELQQKYRVIPVPITESTRRTLANSGLSARDMDRCRNMFALGIAYWLFQRDPEPTVRWIESKFAKKPEVSQANVSVLMSGHSYAETIELFETRYEVHRAQFAPGTYRNITGNTAVALGLITGAHQAGLPALYAGYPITPASDILHELSRYKNFGVRTFQAEDEIAAMCAAIGASYGGTIGMTGSSGPGIALKSEAMNLAIMTELPVVIVDVQRAGPSTGLPTKTEQADLLQVMYGRNGESPMPVLAAATPSDGFTMAVEAVRIALEFMTPVVLLTDGYIANGSEPWKLPDIEALPKIKNHLVSESTDRSTFKAYSREEGTLARPWAPPGLAGFEHRIGGLEKNEAGNISYDGENHERMVKQRAEKVARIADAIPEQDVFPSAEGDVLVVGWGSTYGAIREAVERLRGEGHAISHAHIRYINPFPKNLESILKGFKKILVPEINTGQLAFILRGQFLVDARPCGRVTGRPLSVDELENTFREALKG